MKNNNKTFQNYTLTSPVVMEIMFYLHVCAKDFANKMHRHIRMLFHYYYAVKSKKDGRNGQMFY